MDNFLFFQLGDLLSNYYVLGSGNKAANKRDKNLCPRGAHILVADIENKQSKQVKCIVCQKMIKCFVQIQKLN